METGWVVEGEDNHYIGEIMWDEVNGYSKMGWVSGHANALRFARKEDAEAVERMLSRYGIVLPKNAIGANEHHWDDTVPISEKMTTDADEVATAGSTHGYVYGG